MYLYPIKITVDESKQVAALIVQYSKHRIDGRNYIVSSTVTFADTDPATGEDIVREQTIQSDTFSPTITSEELETINEALSQTLSDLGIELSFASNVFTTNMTGAGTAVLNVYAELDNNQ